MAYNTILLKGEGNNVEEIKASAAITPGMLVELHYSSGDKVRAHNKDDGFAIPMFALESELEGNGIADAYASGDLVRCFHPKRGDQVYALIADGQNIAVGDRLSSNGDGFLREYSSPESTIEETGAVVAIARENVNRSTSSGGDTNTTGRCAVEIV